MQPADGRSWAQRRFVAILVTICAVALAGRVVMLADYLRNSPLAAVPLNDAEVYWDWAGQIAQRDLLQDTPFFSAPLYPYLLGLFRYLGAGLPAVYVIQILMDLATACVLALVGRDRFGARAGLLAAAFFLLLLEPASSALRVLASSEQLLVVALTWAALVAVQKRPSLGRHVVAGVAVGVLALAYAPAILLVGLAPLWLFWQSGRRLADLFRPAVLALVGAAAIAPATLHNWHASGEFFPIRSGSGITLRQGNMPDSYGVYTAVPGIDTRRDRMHADVAKVYREKTGREPTWKAVDKYFRDEVLRYWASEPLRAVGLAIRKFYLFLSSRNYDDIYQPNSELGRGLHPWLRLAPLPVPWLIGPAVVALALWARRPIRYAPEWLLFLLPLLVAVGFFYSARYRIPAVPMIVIAAAAAVHQALAWKRAGLTTLVVLGVLAGMVLGPVNRAAGVDLRDPTMVLTNLAYVLHKQGRPEEAMAQQRELLRIKPDSTQTRIALGDLLVEQGRREEALAEYQKGLQYAPDDLELIKRIGTNLYKVKRVAESVELLTRAVERHPDEALLWAMLSETREPLGQADQARADLRRAAELAPNDASICSAYAALLRRQQRLDEARAEYQRLAEISPDPFEAVHKLGLIAAERGELDLARQHLERALSLKPNSAAVLHDLGVLYFRQDRLPEAVRCFEQARQLDPTSEATRKALRRIEQILATQPATRPAPAPVP